MKRILGLSFTVFVIFSLISCNDNKPSITSEDSNSLLTTSSTIDDDSSSSIEQLSSNNESSSISISSEEEIKTYTVTWKNYDEQVLETDINVNEGEFPSYDGDMPTRENDDTYSYTFTGWTPTLEVVSQDITYIATYSQEELPHYYHVEFVNYDGTLMYEVDVLEGEEAVYVGDTPEKPSDDDYTYDFIGWDNDLSSIAADVVATATYKANKINWGSIIWF